VPSSHEQENVQTNPARALPQVLSEPAGVCFEIESQNEAIGIEAPSMLPASPRIVLVSLPKTPPSRECDGSKERPDAAEILRAAMARAATYSDTQLESFCNGLEEAH